jgi:diacylglycerol kinase (ATP)
MPVQCAKIIVNPAAGANSTYRKWPCIQHELKRIGLPFEHNFTEGRGHAIELAREAAGNGFRYLVAVGGDGTVHEVANGILQASNPLDTKLGIVSTGTGSDLSRSLGIPRTCVEACGRLVNPNNITIDAGFIEYLKNGKKMKRYFVNSAGAGFDAEVVSATEKLPKFFGGTIPYLTGLARSFLQYRNKPVVLKNGEHIWQFRVLSVVVANGKYFGGGMCVAPQASLDDGMFDVVIIENIGKLDLIRSLHRVYKGTHLTHPKIRLEKAAHIELESQEKVLVHADGELLGEAPVSFRLVKDRLRIVV